MAKSRTRAVFARRMWMHLRAVRWGGIGSRRFTARDHHDARALRIILWRHPDLLRWTFVSSATLGIRVWTFFSTFFAESPKTAASPLENLPGWRLHMSLAVCFSSRCSLWASQGGEGVVWSLPKTANRIARRGRSLQNTANRIARRGRSLQNTANRSARRGRSLPKTANRSARRARSVPRRIAS